MLVCSFPKLIAAYHVLHRLSEPRHPPCALNCFKKFEIVLLPDHNDFRPPKIGVTKHVIDKKIDSRLTTLYFQYVKELYQCAN